MNTQFGLKSKQNEKKNEFLSETAEKRTNEKKTKRVRCYNMRHVTYHDKEEYILYSNPIVIGYLSKTKRVKYYTGEDGKEYNAETGELRSDESIELSMTTSLKRTKKKVYEYALANDWSGGWFLTITFDKKHVNRLSYKECYNRAYQFLKNVKDQNPDFKYLLVPEMHKDECWHFHGFGANCEKLKFEKKGIDREGRDVYYVNKRSFKYGRVTATQIMGTDAIMHYISKNMYKDLITLSKEKHRYLHSRNLNKPKSETMFTGDLNLMQLSLSENEDFINSYTVPDKVHGGEITYIKLKKRT